MSKSRLFDAFGELIYAVAMADGVIQKEEISALNKILKGHPWAQEIKWSFDYEHSKKATLKEAYSKALSTFKDYGPAPEYNYLLEVLDEVANAANGIETNEVAIIEQFQIDLKIQFMKDLDEGNLLVDELEN